mgnify:CR=1 FL=1
MRIVLLGAITLALAGCVTVTPPVSMGGGRYMLTLNAQAAFKAMARCLRKQSNKPILFVPLKARQPMF